MNMKNAYSCWAINKIDNKEAVAFAYKWAEAMEHELPICGDSLDIEETIKDVAYITSADASSELFAKARDILIEHWRYGDVLARCT